MREAHVLEPVTGNPVVTVAEDLFPVDDHEVPTFDQWVTVMEHAGFMVNVVEVCEAT